MEGPKFDKDKVHLMFKINKDKYIRSYVLM